MKRNKSVELLRIILMVFIIIHHCIINGYGLKNSLLEIKVVNGYDVFLGCLNSIVIIGVNVFFLISGYFKIKFSWKKLIRLLLDMYIYADTLTFFGIVFGIQPISIYTIKTLLFPFYGYWFVAVYLVIYIVSPVLNKGIETLGRKQAIILAIFFTGLFCVLNFVSEIRWLGLENGYSVMFGMYLYFIGRMMKKYSFLGGKRLLTCIKWVGCTMFTAIAVSLSIVIKQFELAWKLFSYNQIFILFSAVFFLWIFISLPEQYISEKVLMYSPHMLAVYYIHSSPAFSYFSNILLRKIADSCVNWEVELIFLIIYAIIICSVCALVDVVKGKALNQLEDRLSCSITNYLGIAK